MIRRVLLLGAVLGNMVPAAPAESSTSSGVVSVAPEISELGAGWGERNVIFAIDPLEQPAEFVNAHASQNPTNRASIVQLVRKSMSLNGSVGMTEIWYGHSGADLELIISRYPDQPSLDKHWKEFSSMFKPKAVAPKVGQAAGWLDIGAEATGREFVFRQGLFSALVSCKVALSEEPLMKLVKATAAKLTKATDGAATRSQPVGPDTNRTSAVAGSGR